jgi:Holliday junction resolvase
MVHSYAKGYSAERELVHTLSKLGFMTIRAPRSGRIGLPSPDVIAAKDGKLIVFEVKFRESAFTVRPEQLQELVEWRDKAKAVTYLACKLSRRGWKFIHLQDVLENNGNVGKKFIEEKGIGIGAI